MWALLGWAISNVFSFLGENANWHTVRNCHKRMQASGATSWLTKQALGVKPLAAGYARWEAVPMAMGADGGVRGVRWVRGDVPTPAGTIGFAIDIDEGTLSVRVPPNTVASRVAVPRLGTGIASVRIVAASGGGSDGGARSQQIGVVFSNVTAAAAVGAGASAGADAEIVASSGGEAPTTTTSSVKVEHDLRYVYLVNLGEGLYNVTFHYHHRHRQSVGAVLSSGWTKAALAGVGSKSPGEQAGAEALPPRTSSKPSKPSGKPAGPEERVGVHAGEQTKKSRWDPSNTNFSYAATFEGTDVSTSGSWRSAYGKDGYVLFNYSAADAGFGVLATAAGLGSLGAANVDRADGRAEERASESTSTTVTGTGTSAEANTASGAGAKELGGVAHALPWLPTEETSPTFDVVKLPSYIKGVWAVGNVPHAGGPPFPNPSRTCEDRYLCPTIWNRSTTDPRALENPAGGGGGSSPRTAAGLTSKGWASFHLDIEPVNVSTMYTITLYMVDYQRDNIRQAIKCMDGKTQKTIAPMVLIEDFANGVYATYSYNGPMMLRINQVPSAAGLTKGFPPRPTVSGVFFGKVGL
jgi:hypothetical protein